MTQEADQQQLPEGAPEGEQVGEQEVQTEVVDQGEPAPEQSSDADFLAGFNEANGVEPEPEPEQPKIAGYTEDEVRALLEKAAKADKLEQSLSKAFGSLGSLKQRVDDLSSRPTGVSIKGDFKRLAQEYPEMAEALQEDLREAFAAQDQPAQAPQQNPELQQMTLDMVTLFHPKWKETIASQEWESWKQSLPPEKVSEIMASRSPATAVQYLNEFADHQKQVSQQKQNRQSRLEAAVTPRGRQQTTPELTESDAFVKAFNATIRGG